MDGAQHGSTPKAQTILKLSTVLGPSLGELLGKLPLAVGDLWNDHMDVMRGHGFLPLVEYHRSS